MFAQQSASRHDGDKNCSELRRSAVRRDNSALLPRTNHLRDLVGGHRIAINRQQDFTCPWQLGQQCRPMSKSFRGSFQTYHDRLIVHISTIFFLVLLSAAATIRFVALLTTAGSKHWITAESICANILVDGRRLTPDWSWLGCRQCSGASLRGVLPNALVDINNPISF